MKKNIIFLVCFFCVKLWADHYQTIKNLADHYTRPITFLEISNSNQPYIFKLAHVYPRSVAVLITTASRAIGESNIPANVIVLNPQSIPDMALEILGRCEHFDISIINNEMVSCITPSRIHILKSLLKLGDYIFIESEHMAQQLDQEHPELKTYDTSWLYFFHRPKSGLDIARWNLRKMPQLPQYRYTIVSNFSDKYLLKNGHATTWIPGINLITFIMLSGKYPPNNIIIAELRRFKHAEHNDLVPGNFIIQGQKMQPIDFNDKGRNVKSKKSVQAIIKLFKSNFRFNDPQGSLNKYQKKLDKIMGH